MKYKTRREYHKGLSIICLLFGICGFGIAGLCILTYAGESDDLTIRMGICSAIIGIGIFIYCWTCNVKRNRIKKKGERYEANIIGAEWLLNGRGEDTYYLLISFYENGERKIRYTEGYVGSPNYKLKSTKCEIYRWKNKYIETEFEVLDKKENPVQLNIPITKYRFFHKKKDCV